MTTALVLAGHGSHISAETAGIVWRQVDRLRALGVADEVTAAFWKEMPSFRGVFNSLSAEDITVVPLFTAQGYFTQTVIPTEMGFSEPSPPLPPLPQGDGESKTKRRRNVLPSGSPLALRERGFRGEGFALRYARTLSEHPALDTIVRRRVDDAFAALGSAPQQTAIAVIGHSTRRNAESRKATEAQAARLREAGIAAQVETVYLDDTPAIADIYALTDAQTLIAVPFFLAAGSHTTQDVPQALRLPDGAQRAAVNGRDVYYTPPVGDDDSLTDIILDLVREAGAPLYDPRSCGAWDGFPTAGRDVLIQSVRKKGTMRFGQLHLTRNEVRVWGDNSAAERITTPVALRARVREQPFRPLATTADLPTGWQVEIENDDMLHAVVETVYPGAVADWAAQQHGAFTSTPLAATLARQTGLFREIAPMDAAQEAAWVARICGGCVRHPTWHDHSETPSLYMERGRGGEVIPCAEPCNLWLSRVLEDD